MKKLAFLLSIIIILSAIFTSCANVNTTSMRETNSSLNGAPPLHRYTYFYSMDELLTDINEPKNTTKDQELYQKIKEVGKLYYPEIKCDEYVIGGVQITSTSLDYELCPKEAFTGSTDDLFLASEDVFIISVEYMQSFESAKNRLLGDEDFVLLENGSIYSEKLKWIIFEFNGNKYQLNLSENYKGSLDWQDIIDIKYIEVSK